MEALHISHFLDFINFKSFQPSESLTSSDLFASHALDTWCNDGIGWGPWIPRKPGSLPDFTFCFQDTVLLPLPRLFLFVWGSGRLAILLKRPWRVMSGGALAKLKSLCGMLLLMIVSIHSAAKLYYASVPYQWLDSLTDIAATILAIILTREEHLRNRSSSTTLLFYWLAMLVAMSVKLRSLILNDIHHESLIQFWTFVGCIIMTLVMFVLENFPKKAEWRILLDDEQEDPEEVANIWSRLTFSWMDPLMKLGYRQKKLEQQDLWKLASMHQAHTLSDEFQKNWSHETRQPHPSLVRAGTRTVGLYFLSAAPFKLAQDILAFLQPKLLKSLLLFAQSYATKQEPQPIEEGITIALAMFAAATIQTMVLHQYFQRCFITGMHIRSCLITAVYKKALKLSPEARQERTTGEIVNLMGVDSQKLMDLTTYLHILWSGLFQIVLALVMLYQTLGPSVFAGTAVMIIMIPLNAWLARKSRNLQKKQMANKDSRIKLIDEILNGIRVIKLYAWEIPFRNRVLTIRDKELTTLTKIFYLNAFSNLFWSATPFLVAFTTFTVYSLTTSEPLTSAKVFVALALFNLLQFPLSMFPSVITNTVEASVSIQRLQRFLLAEEMDPQAVSRLQLPTFKSFVDDVQQETKQDRVVIKDASFSWSSKSSDAILTDINITVRDGDLLCVTGLVASAKSSLISAILGEMYKISGQVNVNGKIAYVAQTAWIMNATLRENILFGKPYNHQWYKTVVEACCLLPDFLAAPAGDQTEVGEQGITLSGGQRARVSLARAVYSKAQIYLLDDPYSALDAHVAKHVFQKVIGPTGLLQNKARIFVTHGLAFAKDCTKVIVLDKGKIVEQGSCDELKQLGGIFANMMAHYTNQNQEVQETPEDDLDANDLDVDVVLSRQASLEDGDDSLIIPTISKENSLEKLDERTPLIGKTIVQETKAEGAVSRQVYWTYIKACGSTWVFVYLIVLVLSQAFSVLNTFWLADWSGANDGNGDDKSVKTRLLVYGALGFGSAFLVAAQSIIGSVYCAIRSARTLHKDMLENVLHLPQSFFDTTPVGRVVNRFTRDVQVVDDTLPRSFMSFFSTLMRVVGVIFMNAVATPLFMLLVVPLGAAYYWISQFYLTTSRELKRLDSVSRSPIYSHFSETLNGVATIRAYQDQGRFIKENENRIDEANRAYFPSVTTNRWLAVRLEMLGNTMIFGSALFAVIQVVVFRNVSASLIGVAVSSTIAVTQTLNWLIRQSTEIETNIISVERLNEYATLPQEAPYFPEGNMLRPIKDWPTGGEIEFKDYSTRYRKDLDLVLKDINVKINPGEKVGIVGRTGSGKSTMSLALFRIVEAAGGKIVIDGFPIQELGLYDLRSRMTVIPQDPILFNATIRENVDPFGQCTDTELWQVLEASHLKQMIADLPEKLDTIVSQGGANFSLGQRQLLCLARALVRKSAILVLDEATSSTDAITDSAIQETLRTSFASSTLFTIAHRIGSLMDYDKVLVLDQGRIVEFDSPSRLMARPDSLFKSLAIDAGLLKA